MTSKPKTLTLTHPDADRPITVTEGHEDIYLTQGWEIAPGSKPKDA